MPATPAPICRSNVTFHDCERGELMFGSMAPYDAVRTETRYRGGGGSANGCVSPPGMSRYGSSNPPPGKSIRRRLPYGAAFELM